VLSLGGRIRDFTGDLPPSGVSTDAYQTMFSLLLAEALVESGRAMRATRLLVSTLGPRGRNVSLEWVEHTNRGDRPTTCSLSGVMPAR
jgi:hypothetical protein